MAGCRATSPEEMLVARVTLVAPGSQPKLTRSTTQGHAERNGVTQPRTAAAQLATAVSTPARPAIPTSHIFLDVR